MIRKIKLKDFRSHRESEFVFDRGSNLLLGISGAGKSSVLDAICFALFGTTPSVNQKKIKLEDLIRNKPQEMRKAEVELEFEVDGETYKVKRIIEKGKGTSYSELRKNEVLIESQSTTKVTEAIENILKIDFDLFSKVIYTEQDRLDYFLTIPKGQRMKKIDELLKIGKFEEARKIAIRFANRFKEEKENRLRDLEKIDLENLKLKEDELKKELEEKEKELKRLEKEKEELTEKLKSLISKYERLKESKENLEKAKTDKIRLDSKREVIEKRIFEIEKGDLNEELKKLEKLEQEFNEEKERRIKIEKELAQLLFEKKDLENKIKEIERLKERLKEKEKIEMLEKKKKELEEVKLTLSKLKIEKRELEESIEILKMHKEAYCPTCERELSKEKKEELLKKKKDRLEEILKEIKENENSKNRLEEEIKSLEKIKEEILIIEKKVEEEGRLILRKKEVEERIETLSKIEFKDSFLEKELEKVKKRIEELKTLKELEKELKQILETLEEINRTIKSIKFDEEEFKSLEKEVKEKEIEMIRKKEKITFLEREIENKKEFLKQINSQILLAEKFREDAKFYDFCFEKLKEISEGLAKVQVEIRKEFIETLNDIMNEIWEEIYPYQDFIGIRFEIKDNDYVLQLCDLRNVWVNVEGFGSGGERSLACLTLRIALSLTLAPKLRILILDEPTHNLDANSIEKFAEVLRVKISDILDQIFIVTHDDKFTQAVSGKIYELIREDEKRGFTKVKEL